MIADEGGAAIDLPLLDRLRSRRPQIRATWSLIALNLIVFCSMLFFGAGLWHSPNTVQLAWGANFGPATKDGEWWRLGSALFLHFGLLHLAMNMFALWEGGSFVERMVGPRRFLLIYVIAGLLGNLLSLIVQGDHAVAGGASGAIFGIYGALLVCLWELRRQLSPTEFRWLFLGALAFALITVAMGFLIPGIDNAAHIGGFIGGAFAGIALRPPNAFGGAGFSTRLASALALIAAFAGLYISVPAPRYLWSNEIEAREKVSQVVGEEYQIDSSWNSILRQGRMGDASFEELAVRVDTELAGRYEQTFEQLSSLHVNPEVPSAPAIDRLRHYVEVRRDASRQLAEGLRKHDKRQIESALELARDARLAANKPTAGDKGR